jgi:hypothetical protein
MLVRAGACGQRICSLKHDQAFTGKPKDQEKRSGQESDADLVSRAQSSDFSLPPRADELKTPDILC